MASQVASRIAALAALVLGIVVVAVVILRGGGPYVIDARFVDASQLVKGDLVEVGGRKVGTVTALKLSDNGMADVELTIDDDGITPLHEGTTAEVRTVGLASVTNRIVDLQPGPESAPEYAEGGLLPESQTRSVVDLDMVLDSIDPTVRGRLKTIIRESARAFADPAPEQVNAALEYLDPALAQTAALGHELVADQAALERLVKTGAGSASAVASRAEDLGAGLDSAASVMRQVASERAALVDIIGRSPATLRQTRTTLEHLRAALPVLNPVLRDLRPAVEPLGRLLRTSVPVARDAGPAIDQIQALLPQATAILKQIPALDEAASPALASTTKALKGLLPIVAGLRTYTPDLVGGLFNGFGGAPGGYYDANGHYIRISLEGSPASLPGFLAPSPGPGFGGYRTGVDARCPGAAEEPVPDGSNPWIPDASLCDPADSP